MQRAQEELKELFRPTARCFKGFSILLLIWGVASLILCALVPTIILVHNPIITGTQVLGDGDSIDNR